MLCPFSRCEMKSGKRTKEGDGEVCCCLQLAGVRGAYFFSFGKREGGCKEASLAEFVDTTR